MRSASAKQTRLALLLAMVWIASCGVFYYRSATNDSIGHGAPSLPSKDDRNKHVQPYGCNKSRLHALIPCRCGSDGQAERRQRLRHWCDRQQQQQDANEQQQLKDERLAQIVQMTYVDESRKIIYCDVPKVATTNWKRVFLYLSGKWNVSRPEEIAAKDVHSSPVLEVSLPRLSRFSDDEIGSRLQTYTKFFFVRHPMERLVSAFRNKFQNQNNTYFPMRYGRQIIRLYRPNATQDSLERGADVQFNEFVDYLIDSEVKGYDKNPHWSPITSLCRPCEIDYDFVGQLETLSSDADAILAQIGAIEAVRFPARADTYGLYAPSADLLASTFNDVPRDKLLRLLELYRGDMEAFGYNCSCNELFNSTYAPSCSG